MAKKTYDFCGWVTRANVRCSDGRTIMDNAFQHCDGRVVPLVWNHSHNNPNDVLGNVLLEHRPGEGVYGYGTFNDSDNGENAKLLVQHGDIDGLSIYANQLRQQGGNVLHGEIREVSLVMASANPGAFIENVIRHGEEMDDELYINSGETIKLYHSDIPEKGDDGDDKDDGETLRDVFDSMTKKQQNVVYAMIAMALEENAKVSHSDMEDDDSDSEDETIQDVVDTMTEKQKKVMYALIGAAREGEENSKEDANMKHNAFEQTENNKENTLSHSEMETIIGDAKRYGSLRDSFLAHSEEYGIESIEFLFPEARNTNVPPEFIKRDTTWVSKFMGATHHSPFSRIKSMWADITEEDARAKGYIKGKLKKEEVFSLLKRATQPTTIYKKQKMDRDDVVDITDFDVIAWLKKEMREMLDEEIARACLMGDGRRASDDDHIDTNCIRPIVNDEDLFVIRYGVASSSSDESVRAKNFIKACIKARKNYKGAGNVTMFTTEDMLTDMLLLEDTTGRALYKTVDELCTKLRVKEIVTVSLMENLKDKDDKDVYAILVNPADYTIGADKGGSVNMFDDFDIDYNQQKYLIETRCSGSLTKPFSAIVLRESETTASEEPTLKQAKAQLA